VKFHLANFVLNSCPYGFEPLPSEEVQYDGIYRITLEGPWLIIEDSAGDEVLLVTSHPITIRPIR